MDEGAVALLSGTQNMCERDFGVLIGQCCLPYLHCRKPLNQLGVKVRERFVRNMAPLRR